MTTNTRIDIQNKFGNTPLIHATSIGKTEIAAYLIEAGANLNICNASGRTALHCAVVRGAEQLTRHLVVADADLNIKEKQQSDTPLHLAIAIGHNTLERFLIQAGASLDIPNKHQKTPRRMLDEKYSANKSRYTELIALAPSFPPAMLLQNQARRVIRRFSGNRTESLPLPNPLKAYIRGALEHYARDSVAVVPEPEARHTYRIITLANVTNSLRQHNTDSLFLLHKPSSGGSPTERHWQAIGPTLFFNKSMSPDGRRYLLSWIEIDCSQACSIRQTDRAVQVSIRREP